MTVFKARIRSLDSLRKAQKPPGGGWSPIPGGKKGGYRKRKGSGWAYWYPEQAGKGGQLTEVTEEEAKESSLGHPGGGFLGEDSRDLVRSFYHLAKKNDGHWKSDRQARYLQDSLGEQTNGTAEVWAKKIGVEGDVTTFAVVNRIKAFGSKDVSRRRFAGHLFVVDPGGVVAIGKPKYDNHGNLKHDQPIETVFKRAKAPTIRVDVVAERKAAAEKNRPMIDRIEKVLAEQRTDPNDYRFDILEDFLSQLRGSKALSIRQKAVVQKFAGDADGDLDHKQAAKEAHAGYKVAMGRVLDSVVGKLARARNPDMKKQAEPLRRVAGLIDSGKYREKHSEESYHAQDFSDYWARQAQQGLFDAAKVYSAEEPWDVAAQAAKTAKAKKLTKRAARVIDAMARVSRLSEEKIDEVASKIADTVEPDEVAEDPFAQFEKAFVGPKGGLYEDPAHTRPVKAAHCKRCGGSGKVVFKQHLIGGGVEHSTAVCQACKGRRTKHKHGAEQMKLFGKYRLHGETDFQGLDIAIENRKGSKRKWRDENGDEGETVMVHPYGYIRGVKGADGDEVDVYLGPNRESQLVFVVNQRRIDDKRKFDEHKVMLGFDSEEAAKKAYLAHYQPRKLGESLMGSVRTWTMERFKRWLDGDGAKKKPLHKALVVYL